MVILVSQFVICAAIIIAAELLKDIREEIENGK